MFRAECELCSQGKKVEDGRCGRTIEAQPVSDQTCHIEDVVAAPVLIKPDGFRRWRAVIVDLHILPSPMRSPAALRALSLLGLPRPDRAQPSRHSLLPPWTVSAAGSAAGWKALDDGTAGFDTLLSSRPIRASSPFDQPAPWLAPQPFADGKRILPFDHTEIGMDQQAGTRHGRCDRGVRMSRWPRPGCPFPRIRRRRPGRAGGAGRQ